MSISLPGGSEPPPPASNFRRALALIIDVVLLGLAANVLSGLAGLLLVGLAVLGEEASTLAAGPLAALGASRNVPRGLIAIVIYGVYAVPFWGLGGTSLGKWLVGLRIARPGPADRPGLLRAFVRFLALVPLFPILWITGLFGIVGLSSPSMTQMVITQAVLAAIASIPVFSRGDRAGPHDLLARTRLVRASETGFRRILRGGIRRGLTNVRWVVAGLAALILVGAGAFGALRLRDVVSISPTSFFAVDAVTQEAIKGAILEYDRIEEQATLRLDANMLQPRATAEWVARKHNEFAELRQNGILEDSHLVNATFKGFRRLLDDRIEADVIETWQTSVFNQQGQLVQQLPPQDVPQTAILVLEGDRWKLADVRFYEAGQVPF